MTKAIPTPRRVALAGASGTIGAAVLRRLQAEGHQVTALSRGDWADPERLKALQPEVVISCIASRSGAPRDAQAVDYQANSDLLKAAQAAGVGHFILLSAICVQKPLLAFQHAKLALIAQPAGYMQRAVDGYIQLFEQA